MRHPLANIHPEAIIAESAVIDAFSTIQKDVEIGEGEEIIESETARLIGQIHETFVA